MTVIAIDPGKQSGIYVSGPSYTYVTSVDIYDYHRLLEVRRVLEQDIPNLVIAEATGFATSNKTRSPEYHLGGLVFSLGLQHIKLIKIAPTEWRKLLGMPGTTKEAKAAAIEYATKELRSNEVVDHNAAEAYCIYRAGQAKGYYT